MESKQKLKCLLRLCEFGIGDGCISKLSELEESAQKGDYGQYHSLGWIYDEHIQDKEKAILYYKLSMEYNNEHTPKSIFNLAHIYQKQCKHDLAIKLFESIADVDTDALYRLGSIYHRVKKDYDKSKIYYNLGIKRGSAICKVGLGVIHEFVESDYETAFRLYEEAAKSGEGKGVDNMSRMYRTGKGVEKSDEKEFECLANMVSIEELSMISKYNLAYFYLNNRQFRDYDKAVEIHKLLDEQHNDHDSQYILAQLYETGIICDRSDPEQAVKYYLKSARNMCIDAYDKIIELSMNDEYQPFIDKEVQRELFEHWMKFRLENEYHKFAIKRNTDCKYQKLKYPDGIQVPYSVLDDIMREYYTMKQKVLEYELTPPSEGGELYIQAKKRFEENIGQMLTQ